MPWLDRPDYQPYQDIQGVSGKDNGPYLSFQTHYRPYDPNNPGYFDESVHRLFISAATLREEAKGGPFILVDAGEHQSLLEDHHECVEKIAELEKVVERLSTELVDADVERKNIKAMVEQVVSETRSQQTAKARAARKSK